ncbi:hypothetical protein [Adlercreutzia caecimuris]|jgi:hypothetical protein|uniref:Uncharacterized protein n=2 Tax=Adlercreutzia caecimuris TaxID=671266 RepID=R9L6M1_9ACTN|nr:hypothetical protein [Adlercreutzia caecimuris]EOS51387.1 hypothetical protein C811_00786 [Adlercreutzia caecimuris B7]
MAKKDLRAQMDAARAAAAFIGAAQESAHAESEEDAASVASGVKTGGKASEAVAEEAGAPSRVRVEDAAAVGGPQELAVPAAKAQPAAASATGESAAKAPRSSKRTPRQVKNAASDVTAPAMVPDFFADTMLGAGGATSSPASEPATVAGGMAAHPPTAPDTVAPAQPAAKPKRARKPRKKMADAEEAAEGGASRMTAQVLVPMTAEQREHADLLAQVMKITRAEVMRQALDEYWDNHKSELQAAVAAYEQLIRKLMK